MKVLIAGSSGMIGRALTAHLRERGHDVVCLIRSGIPQPGDFLWNPAAGELDRTVLGGVSAVVNLAGENIAAGRWTKSRKQQILRSRVEATRTLVQAILTTTHPPSVFVCASATGIYGDRGEETLTEESNPGSGFLANVCRAWEAEARAVEATGVRAARLRLGVVLTRTGGALAKMIPAFRLGLGGRIGSGRQYWSWISVPDVVRAIEFVLMRDEMRGAVNLTSPHAVTNSEFTTTLAKSLHRPACLPLPAIAAKIVLGQMANEALLASTRVMPSRLLEAGFHFRHPTLDVALSAVLQPQ